MKAHGRALFFASRDWVPDTNDKYELELKENLKNLFIACLDYFHCYGDKQHDMERSVYSELTKISLFIKAFRDRGLPSGEVSRSNQYLSKIIDSFESMKHI